MSAKKNGDIVQILMDEATIKRPELAEKAQIDYQTLSKIVNNSRPLTIESAEKLADFFTRELGRIISIDYLLGREAKSEVTYHDNKKEAKIPVLGTIRAGKPIYAEENIVRTENLPSDILQGSGEYFYLNVLGDSMIDAKIFPGGLALVRKQNWVDNNQVAVVLINGEEATIKRVKWVGDKVVLYAANPNYEPQVYDLRDITILGLVMRASAPVL